MNLPVAPLLAAGLDWLEGLLPFLFVLFWIVSQVIGVFRKVAAPREPAVRPVLRPVPPANDAGDPRAELERQITEFLRQSAEGRSGRTEPAAAPRPTPPRPKTKRVDASRPPTPQPPPKLRGAESRQAADVARPLGALEGRGTDIARHVHDAFAQELGHLASNIASVPGKPATENVRPQAADLVALVRSPATIRQLILVHELLERPEHRW